MVYHYSVDTIRRMTPYQQLVMYSKNEIGSETITFETDEEYQRWLVERENQHG